MTHESKIHEKASPDGIFNLLLINFCVSFLHYDHDEHLLQRGYYKGIPLLPGGYLLENLKTVFSDSF